MKKMKSVLPIFALFIICSIAIILAGCSSSGDGTSYSAGTYSGNSTISGTINLNSLNSSDQSALEEASGSSLPRLRRYYDLDPNYEVDPTTEAVKLFVVGSDGELEDTGITCDCEMDANDGIYYVCPGVKDGVNYIVKYIKLLGDDKAVELKVNAYVPEEATEIDADITAKTSAIVECLTTAILDATEGTGIDQEIVNTIIDAVKTAIETLVNSGAIQIPSMIVDVEGDTISEVFGEDIENDQLASASGTVVSDESVSTQIDVIKTDIQSGKFDLSDIDTDYEKETLIDPVFKEMLEEDGDVPSFMKDFFTDKYIENGTVTVGELADAILAGIEFYKAPPIGFDPNDTAAVITKLKGELGDLYTLLDAKAIADNDPNQTLDPNQLAKLANYPPVIIGLFPADENWDVSLSSSSVLNVPQAIAFTIYEVDVYYEEAYEDPNAVFEGTEGEDGSVSYDKEDACEFNPMAPGSIMEMLGFFDPEVISLYAVGVDIYELWLHPGICWIEETPGEGEEVDSLNAGTCWGDLGSMIGMDPNTPMDPNYTVTLTYPKVGGGYGVAELMNEAVLRGEEFSMNPFDNCWVLDPWRMANPNQPGPGEEWNQPDPDTIISDFTSGTYTVTVITPDAESYSRAFTRKVITGMTDIYPKLVSPAPMPIWPGHDADPNEMQAFNDAMAVYQETLYNATVDTDDDGTDDAAKITVAWQPPQLEEGTIPDGVKMGYEMEVGWGGCDPDPNNGCFWDIIYATWEHDKVLFGTSFTVPVLVPKKPYDPYLHYNVNIHIVFIDSETGMRLGQGGSAHGQFRVGDPIVLSNTFTITGPVTIKDMREYPGEELILSDINNMKAMLFRETYDDGNPTNPWSREILLTQALLDDPNGSGIIYKLTPEIGDFLDPNADPGAWVGIDVFHDINNDGEVTESLGSEPWHEPQWGPLWDAEYNVWFSTWGGMLRVQTETCDESGCEHQETIITGGETVDGPIFEIEIWYDPNVTL